MDRQHGPATEQISWYKPLKEKLPALFGNDETSGEAFRQQEIVVGGVNLIRGCRVSAESVFGCCSKVCLALERGQAIERFWLRVRA